MPYSFPGAFSWDCRDTLSNIDGIIIMNNNNNDNGPITGLETSLCHVSQ